MADDAAEPKVVDASFNRRGNAGLRKDLEQARRIYNPEEEKEWGLKYRNFSSDHMRRAYKVYAEARHDPFNKSPGWSQAVIKKISKKFLDIGVSPEEEFNKLDVSGDGVLNRAEVRNMFLDVLPELGDVEITAVFELLDVDHDDEISLTELTKLFWGKRSGSGGHWTKMDAMKRTEQGSEKSKSSNQSANVNNPAEHHRTPVHRVKRIPPAQVEGWDHLQRGPEYKQEADLLKDRDTTMFKRLGAQLSLSPRQTNMDQSKYSNFGGGADTDRFRKNQFRKDEMSQVGAVSTISMAPSSVPDPGGLDIKPGYHIELTRVCPHYASSTVRKSRATPRVNSGGK